MKIYKDIKKMCIYAINEKMIDIEDYDYAINQLTDILNLDTYIDVEGDYEGIREHQPQLDCLLGYAFERGLHSPDTTVKRDQLEAKIMDVFVPRPSVINETFNRLLKEGPKKATDYFYNLSEKSNYIKTSRTSKNIRWKSNTPYGVLDMTINLSKPEKDPRDIINQSKEESSEYPKCLLCKEQVGYYGAGSKPGRTNHRIIHMKLNNEDFYLQYSPYVYYNEHSIVLKKEHEPMKVTIDTFRRLFDFVDKLPHYFLGSNAGLPIVGGSILSHEHYQGGRYHFPIEDAKVISEETIEDVTIKQLYWPLSVIRLESKNREALIGTADKLFKFWENYNDEAAGIYSHTDKPHNAITPIARKNGAMYILDIALRNNLTTKEYPLGIFHPHKENHHIKKENIGLIEVMGLAVLPARLKEELEDIKEVLMNDKKEYDKGSVHKEWVDYLKTLYKGEEVEEFINEQVALKFVKCIENSGVFKQTQEGKQQFNKLTEELIRYIK